MPRSRGTHWRYRLRWRGERFEVHPDGRVYLVHQDGPLFRVSRRVESQVCQEMRRRESRPTILRGIRWLIDGLRGDGFLQRGR